MNSFLIWTTAGNVEVPIIERFTHFIGGEHHEFVIHEYKGVRTLSQYRTGYKICDNAPATVSGCGAHLDSLQQKHGIRYVKQVLNEQETINPQPTKEVDMSLEDAIHKNTLAIEAITAALLKSPAATTGAVVSEPLAAKGETKKEESAADRKKRMQEEKALFDLQQAEKANAAAKDKAPALDFEKDVKPLIVKISVEKGREKAIALMQRFGVSKSPDLLPDQYADVVKQAKAILEEGKDPEAGSSDDI